MKAILLILVVPAAAWLLMWIIDTLATREVYGRVMSNDLADKLLSLLNREMRSGKADASGTIVSLGGPGYFATVNGIRGVTRKHYYFSTQSVNARVPMKHGLHERIQGLLEHATPKELCL